MPRARGSLGAAVWCLIVGVAAATQPLYLVNAGTCPFVAPRGSTGVVTFNCTLGGTSMAGNTIRAGFVWSGSVRGHVDSRVTRDERKGMTVSIGDRRAQQELLQYEDCVSNDACSPLSMSMDFSLSGKVSLGWAVLSTTKPKAEDTSLDWFGWKQDLNYAVAGLFALPASIYALYVFFVADDSVFNRGGRWRGNAMRRFKHVRMRL